ncbi:glycoside hydrolase [Cohnella sp. AR92]|uniref:glycoside hydrolase family 38 N-terminal domain-containing protein n=1 Tax=Cohnella sp. AR92 TaxID=648716 RepID=UPI000F8DC25E|nr:glycoside hydrolase [Cohnella sp. AR92]RUS48692.1 glycoside hydrolase [Cohnella sp. AR92]
MDIKKKWKLYLIHHTHTDIGYTDRQEKIERYHAQFLNQAVKLQKEKEGFKWVCETFWAVERFLQLASAEQVEAFEEAVQAGNIELTANYLNLTELADYELMLPAVRRAAAYGRSLGIEMRSAMAADINGFRLDNAKALMENGVENLFFCVHTHHGMYPARRKQYPFWWETEPHRRLLVWNSEHYMLGNDLGLVPKGIQSYLIDDEYNPPMITENEEQIRYERVTRYLGQLEAEGYPFDFVPIPLSGLVTDNAPPNGAIVDLVRDWNDKHGERIHLEMATLHSFFGNVRSEAGEIPVYRGEWPDWWSDGYASTPESTRLFRQGQRNLQLAGLLQEEDGGNRELRDKAAYQLMMYAEHTWGHSASVAEPFSQLSNAMLARKQSYAAEGARLSCILLDDLYERMGETELYPWRPLRYKIVNPYPEDAEDFAQLLVDSWEIGLLEKGIRVIDTATGEELKHQFIHVSRGRIIMVPLRIKANGQRILAIEPVERTRPRTISSFTFSGSDGVTDVRPLPEEEAMRPSIVLTEHSLETPYLRIKWKQGVGIISWFDKENGRELIRPEAEHTAFAPVYEISPSASPEAQANIRRAMGRNRKGMNVRRSVGRLIQAKPLFQGDVLACVELVYETPGMRYYSAMLTANADMRRVDVALRIQKDCVWDPENVYISLPFEAERSEHNELWLDKGCRPMRPWEDQIWGTGTDFYTVQHGVVVKGASQSVIISMPDTPLVQVGSLEYEERLLSGHPELASRQPNLYTWLMTNYWETNFKASLEGFYEFKYSVAWGNEWPELDQALAKCRMMGTGIVSLRTDRDG